MSVKPEQMDLEALSSACQRESLRFFRDEPNDDRYCYELFRRAIHQRDEYAWEFLWVSYANLVRGWIRRNSLTDVADTPIDELMTISYARFWAATSRIPFSRFPTLQTILQYLQLCCTSAVLDRARRARRDGGVGSLDNEIGLSGGSRPDHLAVDSDHRQAIWTQVYAVVKDESERTLLDAYFVQGLAPRQILAIYGNHFERIEDIYRIKRNLMNRLRNDGRLRDFLGGK